MSFASMNSLDLHDFWILTWPRSQGLRRVARWVWSPSKNAFAVAHNFKGLFRGENNSIGIFFRFPIKFPLRTEIFRFSTKISHFGRKFPTWNGNFPSILYQIFFRSSCFPLEVSRSPLLSQRPIPVHYIPNIRMTRSNLDNSIPFPWNFHQSSTKNPQILPEKCAIIAHHSHSNTIFQTNIFEMRMKNEWAKCKWKIMNRKWTCNLMNVHNSNTQIQGCWMKIPYLWE
jgi:hypothetical protein